ncbi:MAG TPA: hypothetical protein VFL93_11320 [Longimicrobiaceae bacterium]|nr:hypothetical protein [Longimicrobiaceae bacterium]
MRRLLSAVAALLLCSTSLGAQTLRDRVSSLFEFGTCGEPLCLNVPNNHGRHFIPELVEGNSNVIGFLADAIGTSISGIPISSASGGYTYQFVNGAPVQTSISAGPIFGERAPTLGRHRVLLGANLTRFSFQSLRGVPMNDLEFNFTHQNVGSPVYGDPEFENDVLEVHTAVDFSLAIGTIYAAYGLLDWLDVGVAVPLVHASLRGSSAAMIQAFEGADTPHQLTPGSITAETSNEGSATGVGDVALRMKANLTPGAAFDFGVLGDVRLPTGDEQNFLGTGYVTARGLAILSTRIQNFSPHLNGGFLYRGGADANDAILLTAGFDQLISSRATLAFDVLSEWVVGDPAISVPGPVEFTQPFVRSVQPSSIPNMRDDIVNAAIGAKLLVGRGVTVVVDGLAPLNRGGMRPDWGWTVGLERGF